MKLAVNFDGKMDEVALEIPELTLNPTLVGRPRPVQVMPVVPWLLGFHVAPRVMNGMSKGFTEIVTLMFKNGN